jgi:hypothetical protein
VCKGRGPKHPVEAHEEWEYQEAIDPLFGGQCTQFLVKLVALCPLCHQVKHMGFAAMNGQADSAMKHLAAVNGWSTAQVEKHVDAAFREWERRSRLRWSLDIHRLHGYLPASEAHAAMLAAAKGRT